MHDRKRTDFNTRKSLRAESQRAPRIGSKRVGTGLESIGLEDHVDDLNLSRFCVSRRHVVTLMSNVLVSVSLGPIRPYGTIGLGLLRTNVDFTAAGLANVRNSGLGWDVGGGLFVDLMPHVGVRADLRHYRGTGDLNIVGLSLQGSPLDFSRASAALVLKF